MNNERRDLPSYIRVNADGMFIDDRGGEATAVDDWAEIAYALQSALAEALDGWEQWNRGYNQDTGSGDGCDPRIAEIRAKYLGRQ